MLRLRWLGPQTLFFGQLKLLPLLLAVHADPIMLADNRRAAPNGPFPAQVGLAFWVAVSGRREGWGR